MIINPHSEDKETEAFKTNLPMFPLHKWQSNQYQSVDLSLISSN